MHADACQFPFMSQETAAAFFITLPVVGECPAGTIPVYRVFSNRANANHRHTSDRTVRTQMAGLGLTVEGDGADFVVMCAPPPWRVQAWERRRSLRHPLRHHHRARRSSGRECPPT